jgi:hypothetical protein
MPTEHVADLVGGEIHVRPTGRAPSLGGGVANRVEEGPADRGAVCRRRVEDDREVVVVGADEAVDDAGVPDPEARRVEAARSAPAVEIAGREQERRLSLDELFHVVDEREMDAEVAPVDRVDAVDRRRDRRKRRGDRPAVLSRELPCRRRRDVVVRNHPLGVGERRRARIRLRRRHPEVVGHAARDRLSRLRTDVPVEVVRLRPNLDRARGREHQRVEPERSQIEPRDRGRIVHARARRTS